MIAARSPAEKQRLLGWLGARVETEPFDLVGAMPFEIAEVVRDGETMGVVLYTNFRDASIEMAWAGRVGWLTRTTLRAMWSYPFRQLACRVVTGLVKASNARSLDVAERMGCRRCGVIPDWYDDDDAVVFAMTPDRCRWVG